MSYNLWNYGQSNPISYTDPTGHTPCGLFGYFSGVAADYVDQNVNLPKTDWLNTYTAAGVGVQCWGQSYDWNANDDYDGLGPAKITNKQTSTPWGDVIKDDQGIIRGHGLLCYIVKKSVPRGWNSPSLCICDDEKSIIGKIASGEYVSYRLETPQDQTEMKWAVEYMRRRIKLVIDACKERKCGDTDIYIAAAMAQNGSGFTKANIEKRDIGKLDDNERLPGGVNMDWNSYFEKPGNADDTSVQLQRFTNVTLLLIGKGWTVPNINWVKVTELSRIGN